MTSPSPAPAPVDRAAVNRANAQHSTGPRTEAGKQSSSQNALKHGLTAQSPVLPTEDAAAFERHVQQFLDEYRPATATETQLVIELANTGWRLNRIPLLEADLLRRAANLPEQSAFDYDFADAQRLLVSLGLHGHRLSRQFEKTLDKLREIQTERRHHEHRELDDAAHILEYHNFQGIPWDPAELGFVFSKEEVQRYATRLIKLNESRHVAYCRFNLPNVPSRNPATVGATKTPAPA